MSLGLAVTLKPVEIVDMNMKGQNVKLKKKKEKKTKLDTLFREGRSGGFFSTTSLLPRKDSNQHILEVMQISFLNRFVSLKCPQRVLNHAMFVKSCEHAGQEKP